jgi:hypothetical protein
VAGLAASDLAPPRHLASHVAPEDASLARVGETVRSAAFGDKGATVASFAQVPNGLPSCLNAGGASRNPAYFGHVTAGSPARSAPYLHLNLLVSPAGNALGYHSHHEPCQPNPNLRASPAAFGASLPTAQPDTAHPTPSRTSSQRPTLSPPIGVESQFLRQAHEGPFYSERDIYTLPPATTAIFAPPASVAHVRSGYSFGLESPITGVSTTDHPFFTKIDLSHVGDGHLQHQYSELTSATQLPDQMRIYEQVEAPSECPTTDTGVASVHGTIHGVISQHWQPLDERFTMVDHGPDGAVVMDESDTEPGTGTMGSPATIRDIAASEMATNDTVDMKIKIIVDVNRDTSAPHSGAARGGESKPSKLRKPRDPFSPEKRRQTAETRKNTACVRCANQRTRVSGASSVLPCTGPNKTAQCVPQEGDPGGPCKTCAEVDTTSKKFTHNLPCFRYRLTDAKVNRLQVGEDGCLNLTKRWSGFQMRDIDRSDWDSNDTREITLMVNMCGAPFVIKLDVEVRKFKPKEGDVLHRQWRDGNNKFKHKRLEPYALASISKHAATFEKYIHDNAVRAMLSYSDFLSRDDSHRQLVIEDPLVVETYRWAAKHYRSLLNGESKEESEEASFMGSLIRLWFAIRKLCPARISVELSR